MKYIIIALCLTFFFSACENNQDQVRELQNENDSLRNALVYSYEAVGTLAEIEALMDSIDKKRAYMNLELDEGMEYNDFVKRMESLNEYVEESEAKIAQLEKKVAGYGQLQNSVSWMKKELNNRSEAISTLKAQVEEYKMDNDSLIMTVSLQEEEIQNMDFELEVKKQELDLMSAKIDALAREAKITEAEAYFARAAAVEEAADRTQLAPRKKKRTYQEALDLYKKAYEMGVEEAKPKIDEIEEKI